VRFFAMPWRIVPRYQCSEVSRGSALACWPMRKPCLLFEQREEEALKLLRPMLARPRFGHAPGRLLK